MFKTTLFNKNNNYRIMITKLKVLILRNRKIKKKKNLKFFIDKTISNLHCRKYLEILKKEFKVTEKISLKIMFFTLIINLNEYIKYVSDNCEYRSKFSK